MPTRKGRKSLAQTPAPKSERIYGSSKNPSGSAKSEKSAKKIQLSSTIITTLAKKLSEFKKDNPSKKGITLNDLKAVYRRGSGAYSSSHRPTITGGKPNTRNAWAMARVNKFLKKASGEKVKAAYVQDDDLMEKGGLIAPNGKRSNLTPEQYKLVRTPEFKAWFGDWENDPENASKVVDENGEPLVVYHGTNKSFNKFRDTEFDNFIFFTNDKEHSDIYGSKIKEVFLNIKNPSKYFYSKQDLRDNNWDGVINHYSEKDFYKEKTRIYGALKSNQIKLADGSNTTFDTRNPDIRYAGGGDIIDACIEEVVNIINSIQAVQQYFVVDGKLVIIFKDELMVYAMERINHHINQFTECHHVLNPEGNINYKENFKSIYFKMKPDTMYAGGGKIKNKQTDMSQENKETYRKWKTLVNMSRSELQKFYDSPEGKKAGLSVSEAKKQGIDSGRESARWIMKMKETPYTKWTPTMWKWAKKQISFISRMSGMEGKLMDENGNKTRKHLALLIWGHNPNKKEAGGEMDVRMEDTVQRMDDPHFADISYYDEGGDLVLQKDKTLEEVAIKQGIDVEDLKPQLEKGIKAEMEHTDNPEVAEKIALDHIDENPNYYDYLSKMEEQMSKEELMKKNSFEFLNDAYDLPMEELEQVYNKGIDYESAFENDYESVCRCVVIKMMTEPKYYSALERQAMEAEGDKLEGYYDEGGKITQQCQIFDESGEPAIDEESIAKLSKCVEDLPQTKSMYYDFENNQYDPQRRELHKEIIKEFKEKVYCIKGDKKPIAILMGGSPASGKSTFVKKFAPYLLTNNILKIDADEIRSKLPEYQGFNASQTHLETKDIVNTLLSDRNIGIPCKFDLLYDGTMNNTKSYTPLINLLKSIGYEIFIIYIDKVPYEVVKKRALNRYKQSGRFVPVEVIDDFFYKGTEALERLKTQVDGYIVVDGSTPEYKVMEKGGKPVPKFRDYDKIGEPITIDNQDIISEFKKGGEIEPDNQSFKQTITHKSGSAGGMLVGKRHSEGGIKAINKSTNQPLEMEGGEVVITRNAVSDNRKRMFEGKMMTNKEILSKINQSGGGVAFDDGGEVPEKCSCKGHNYKYGGNVLKDFDIVKSINKEYEQPAEIVTDLTDDMFMVDADKDNGFVILNKKYVPSFNKWKEKGMKGDIGGLFNLYKEYLYATFGIVYSKLPFRVQMGLLVNNTRNLDLLIK